MPPALARWGRRRRPPGSCYQSDWQRDATGPVPRLAPCPGPARPAGRRAALLCQGLTLAAFPLGLVDLAVGPVHGQQPHRVGGPPPGPLRRPGDGLVFGLGEVDRPRAYLFSRRPCPNPPPAFCATFSTRWHYNAARKPDQPQSLYISYVSSPQHSLQAMPDMHVTHGVLAGRYRILGGRRIIRGLPTVRAVPVAGPRPPSQQRAALAEAKSRHAWKG